MIHCCPFPYFLRLCYSLCEIHTPGLLAGNVHSTKHTDAENHRLDVQLMNPTDGAMYIL